MLDKQLCPSWPRVNWLLSQFGTLKTRRIERYIEIELIQQGLRRVDVWQNLRAQVFLGTDEFVQAMQNRLADSANLTQKETPRIEHRALAKSLNYYRDEFDDAKLGMAAAYAAGDYRLLAIADAFGVHYSTVSRALNGK